jgi:hypothetical protein
MSKFIDVKKRKEEEDLKLSKRMGWYKDPETKSNTDKKSQEILDSMDRRLWDRTVAGEQIDQEVKDAHPVMGSTLNAYRELVRNPDDISSGLNVLAPLGIPAEQTAGRVAESMGADPFQKSVAEMAFDPLNFTPFALAKINKLKNMKNAGKVIKAADAAGDVAKTAKVAKTVDRAADIDHSLLAYEAALPGRKGAMARAQIAKLPDADRVKVMDLQSGKSVPIPEELHSPKDKFREETFKARQESAASEANMNRPLSNELPGDYMEGDQGIYTGGGNVIASKKPPIGKPAPSPSPASGKPAMPEITPTEGIPAGMDSAVAQPKKTMWNDFVKPAAKTAAGTAVATGVGLGGMAAYNGIMKDKEGQTPPPASPKPTASEPPPPARKPTPAPTPPAVPSDGDIYDTVAREPNDTEKASMAFDENAKIQQSGLEAQLQGLKDNERTVKASMEPVERDAMSESIDKDINKETDFLRKFRDETPESTPLADRFLGVAAAFGNEGSAQMLAGNRQQRQFDKSSKQRAGESVVNTQEGRANRRLPERRAELDEQQQKSARAAQLNEARDRIRQAEFAVDLAASPAAKLKAEQEFKRQQMELQKLEAATETEKAQGRKYDAEAKAWGGDPNSEASGSKVALNQARVEEIKQRIKSAKTEQEKRELMLELIKTQLGTGKK